MYFTRWQVVRFKITLSIIPSHLKGEKMKKLLLLVLSLILLLACNFGVSVPPIVTVTPTIASAVPTVTPEPSLSAPATGTITGKLSYPSEFIPPLRVVAFGLTDGKAYFIDTAENQQEYSLQVPAGTYNVVSYLHEGVPGNTGQVDSYIPSGGPFAGGYTAMVPCGLAAGCDDHTLLPVTVSGGDTVTADPGDWYAPEGTFPPMPNP
jgi:hypothetical protein